MDVDASAGAQSRQLREAPRRSADRHVRHVLRAFGSEAQCRQLVARPERPIEEHRIRARQRLPHVRSDGAHAAEVRQSPASALADEEADAVLGIRRTRLLEMHRRLAGNDHRLGREAGRLAVDADDLFFSTGLEQPPRHLPGEALQRAVEHVVAREAALDRLGGVDDERM